MRLKQTALDTPKAEIDKCMASMRRRCRALVDSGGEWTKGDKQGTMFVPIVVPRQIEADVISGYF